MATGTLPDPNKPTPPGNRSAATTTAKPTKSAPKKFDPKAKKK